MRTHFAVVATLALFAAPAEADAPTPRAIGDAVALTRARALTYAYEISLEDGVHRVRFVIDPAATETPRVRLIEPATENDLSLAGRMALQAARRNPNPADIWCASARFNGAKDFAPLRETPQSLVYSFTPSPEQVGGERDAARHLRGEATIGRSETDISAITITSQSPFHTTLALVSDYRMQIACAPAPNGRLYTAVVTRLVRGSILTRPFNIRSVERVRLLPSVRPD